MNEAFEIVNEDLQEEFIKIMDDNAAEALLRKIAEEQAETQRYINVCDTFISEYAFKKQKAQEEFDKRTHYYKQQLESYFRTIQPKVTKTQATYKLPSGTLKLKYGTTEFIRENETLLKWLKESGRNELIKVKEEPNWAELKKEVANIKNGIAVTKDGEIIEGVTAKDRPDQFEIDL